MTQADRNRSDGWLGRVFRARIDRIEETLVHWLARHSVPLLRGGLEAVFLWFGALKYIPGASPAQGLVIRTVDVLTLGMFPPEVGLVLVASLECAIGIRFLMGRFMRLTLVLMAFQMVGALSLLVMFPEIISTMGPYALTLEGQYIIKNVVLIGAGLVLGVTVRGGRIVSEPEKI